MQSLALVSDRTYHSRQLLTSIFFIQAYPKNLTLPNFLDWVCLPTLVYELEYPRQERINWWYVLEKTTATFGVLCVMMVISQAFIYPPVAKTVAMKEAGMPIEQRWYVPI